MSTAYKGCCFVRGQQDVWLFDLDSGEPRSSTLKDLYDIGRLVDSLDHIHFFLRPCIPTDIPEADYDVNMFYACLKATGKHVMSGVNDEAGLNRIIEMAAMLVLLAFRTSHLVGLDRLKIWEHSDE